MNRLIFLHIPKAAGTTFTSEILKKQYKEDNCFHISPNKNSIEYFLEKPQREKNNTFLLTGHIPFGYHKCFSGNTRYVTFARNPIDRMVSHYQYVKHHKTHPLRAIIEKGKLSFVEYALSDLSTELDNGQTRQLAGIDVPINQVDERMLNIAKENILKSIDIGITEMFDESIILLRDVYNWKKNVFYCKKNVTIKKTLFKLSQAGISAVEERNKYDVELYNWCLNLFNKRINEIPSFKSKFKIYIIQNRLYSLFYCIPRFIVAKIIRKAKFAFKDAYRQAVIYFY